MKRISHFLCLEEEKEAKESTTDPENAIEVEKATFAWGDEEPCLKEVSLRIKKGSLVAVVGDTGCGKSSFLLSLLGALTRCEGAVRVSGSFALSEQQAWIINDSVRNNVLMGSAFDATRFARVIAAAQMQSDLVLLGGEDAEIGDHGINVSGGQKARISLARCCYSDADIVLLDDPLAAVDARVGNRLFHECIRKELGGRTRVLTTNAVQFLPFCDQVVVIREKRVAFVGSYAEYVSYTSGVSDVSDVSDVSEANRDKVGSEEKHDTNVNDANNDTTATDNSPSPNTEEEAVKTHLTSEEEKEHGTISFSVLGSYCRAFGTRRAAFLVLLLLLTVASATASQLWISGWTGDPCMEEEVPSEACLKKTSYYSTGFFVITAFTGIFTVIRLILQAQGRVSASRAYHKELTEHVVSAPVAFFDVNPVGRITNRFNRDMYVVDFDFPYNFFNFLGVLVMVVSDCLVIVGIAPPMVVILVLTVLAWLWVHSLFTRGNADFQRIEGLERSRLFNDFQSVLAGRDSIAAYGREALFTAKMERALDRSNVASVFSFLANYWFCIRAAATTSFINFALCLLSILFRSSFSAANLGAALSSAIGLSSSISSVCDTISCSEMNLVSIERIRDFCKKAQPEAPMTSVVPPPAGWPSEGRVELQDVQMRYRDGPLILKGVNLRVEPHEKVGIVGRTGAGKSSLTVALFRINPLSGGRILIDGVDTATLGLEDARRALCIIPQDPVLFCASVRFNIDPFNEYSDEAIWGVLEQVQLKEAITKLGGLDSPLEEGGENLSVGNRQLICVIRALLRKPKILLMDEATSSLDNGTDAMLQEVIRREFSQCTCLTIAHRLNTVMDADRICVMEKGEVKEYDSPRNLWEKEGLFHAMVVATNDRKLMEAL